jgi:hypothetical protein
VFIVPGWFSYCLYLLAADEGLKNLNGKMPWNRASDSDYYVDGVVRSVMY